MFGDLDYTFVPNAIHTSEYLYHADIRESMRKEWNVENKNVYGHVGNFVYAKNHLFLLEVFKEITRKDENAVLFLVGEGELRKQIEDKIAELGLQDKVILIGRRKDVVRFLQMFDLFLFPSVYEGLPVSMVEAQCSGLSCLISASITDEIMLTDCVKQLGLEKPVAVWAKTAMDMLEAGKKTKRHSREDEIKRAGYGIEELVKFYEKI